MGQVGVERSIWIGAARERVWRALTDPEQIERWFSPGTRWELSSLETGGRLYVRDAETGGELYTQVIEAIEAPYRLVLHSAGEPPANPESRTFHTLVEEKGGTRLSLRYTVYGDEADGTLVRHIEMAGQGFTGVLENIAAHVEGRALVHPKGF